MALERLLDNYIEAAAVIMFAVGLVMLAADRNLIKKIIGLNIMDAAMYLLLTALGYIENGVPPIVAEGAELYVNPIPAGLVLTGIVVSVSVTAVMLALTVKLYKKYGSLDIDRIYMRAQEDEER